MKDQLSDSGLMKILGVADLPPPPRPVFSKPIEPATRPCPRCELQVSAQSSVCPHCSCFVGSQSS